MATSLAKPRNRKNRKNRKKKHEQKTIKRSISDMPNLDLHPELAGLESTLENPSYPSPGVELAAYLASGVSMSNSAQVETHPELPSDLESSLDDSDPSHGVELAGCLASGASQSVESHPELAELSTTLDSYPYPVDLVGLASALESHPKLADLLKSTLESHPDLDDLETTLECSPELARLYKSASESNPELARLGPVLKFHQQKLHESFPQLSAHSAGLLSGSLPRKILDYLKRCLTKNPAIRSYYNMAKTLSTFLGPETPNSVAADEEGLATAKFLLENATLGLAVEEHRKKLQHETNTQLRQIFGLPAVLPAVLFSKAALEIKVTMFKNWANTLDECNGLMLYAKPKVVEEVRAVIKAAGMMNPVIKVGFGGAYHSWSPLFPDKCSPSQISIILNMCDLCLPGGDQKRIKFEKDEQGCTYVTIVPGVTTGELMQVFLEEGLCFESDVVLMGVTYGGVIPTGCHGVGKDQTVLADWVSKVKIVNSEGEVKTYPDEWPGDDDEKEKAMKAIKINMGVFGAIVEMTIKVEALKTARVDTSYPTLGSLLYGGSPALPQILRDNWSVEILWFPFNSLSLLGGVLEGMPLMNIWQPKLDEVWVRAINRDDRFCEANRMKKLEQKVTDTLQHQVLGSVVNPVIKQYPTLTPLLLSSSLKLIKATNPPGTSYEPMPYGIHFRYGISLGPVYDMEFGFPFNLDKDDEYFEKLKEAMRFVVDKSKEYTLRGIDFITKNIINTSGLLPEYPLSTVMELRVIGKSDTLLCPASKRPNDGGTTHTAYLEILSFTGTTNYQEFFKEVGKKWMELGGAPHWCKQWTFLEDGGNPKVFDYVRNKYYRQNLNDYCKVLHDHHRSQSNLELKEIFMNSTMKKLLRSVTLE